MLETAGHKIEARKPCAGRLLQAVCRYIKMWPKVRDGWLTTDEKGERRCAWFQNGTGCIAESSTTLVATNLQLGNAGRNCTVGDVDGEEDDGLEALVEQVGLPQLRLEVGAARQHQPRHIGAVVGDEVLRRLLRHLRHGAPRSLIKMLRHAYL